MKVSQLTPPEKQTMTSGKQSFPLSKLNPSPLNPDTNHLCDQHSMFLFDVEISSKANSYN